MSRILSNIGSALGGLFRGFRPAAPSVTISQTHRNWLHEQLREYSSDRLYASPRDSDLNPTGETWEMRLAYRKALKEPAIKGPLLKKVYAVASLDVQVLPEDADAPADRDAADWFDWAVSHARGGWPRLLHDCCVHPLIEGFAVGEKVTERVTRGKYKGRWGLHAVKFKETESLRFHLDRFRNVVSVRSFAAGMGGQEFDPSDFLLLTHIPLWENPFGQSDLRAAYRAFHLIEAAIKLRAILLENFSGPFLVFKNSQPTLVDQARQALAAARSRGYIVISPEDDLQVVNLATSAPDQFQTTIDDLRKEAATAIAGAYLQMLESESPQGNSETHKGVSELFEWWLAASVGSAITEQLVPDLHDPHYPDTVGRPRVILGGVDPQAATKAGEKLKLAKDLGLPVSKKQAYELVELEPPNDPDDTLGGQPPGGPGGLPGMGGVSPGNTPEALGGGQTAPTQAGQDDSAPVPPELLAAMIQAAESEDWEAVAQLQQLAGDQDRLADVLDPQPKQFADDPQRRDGEVWQGKGGRWFTKKSGRVVPARNPNAEQPKTRDPAAPKRDVVAEARAAKAGREPRREQARTQWKAALQDPRRVTAAQLPALADGLRSLTRDELREMGRGLRQKLGGLKEDLVQRLLSHVGAKGAGGAVKTTGQYGAWGQAAGGGERPASRDEFPKRGVSAGESSKESSSPPGLDNAHKSGEQLPIDGESKGNNSPEWQGKASAALALARSFKPSVDKPVYELTAGELKTLAGEHEAHANKLKQAANDLYGDAHWAGARGRDITPEERERMASVKDNLERVQTAINTHTQTAADFRRRARTAPQEAKKQRDPHEMSQADYMGGYSPRGAVGKELLAEHRGYLEEALAAGKPVPPEVLADYPDLAEKYGGKTTDTPFTGTDAQGREWRDGKLVAKVEEEKGPPKTREQVAKPAAKSPKKPKPDPQVPPEPVAPPQPAAEPPAQQPEAATPAAPKPQRELRAVRDKNGEWDTPVDLDNGRKLLANRQLAQIVADSIDSGFAVGKGTSNTASVVSTIVGTANREGIAVSRADAADILMALHDGRAISLVPLNDTFNLDPKTRKVGPGEKPIPTLGDTPETATIWQRGRALHVVQHPPKDYGDFYDRIMAYANK